MPTTADGAAIWTLVRDGGVLELNTPYCYLLMCRYFAESCVVAEADGRVVGAVIAFRIPERPETVFVWQIGVARSQRGRGLGTMLLDRLVRQTGARALEATVTPSNEASWALFRALARRRGATCETSEGFPAAVFPAGGHEDEVALRIAPLESSRGDGAFDGRV